MVVDWQSISARTTPTIEGQGLQFAVQDIQNVRYSCRLMMLTLVLINCLPLQFRDCLDGTCQCHLQLLFLALVD